MKHLLPLAALVLGCSACQAPTQTLWKGGAPTEEGWRMAGPGEFVVEGGELKSTGGMGLLWYEARAFEDFRLELQWRVEDPAHNSGIFVRFPNPGDDPWVAVHEGYELQICDTGGPKTRTGSVYDIQGSSAVPTKPAGEWNDYTVEVVGQLYTVTINGVVVNRFEGDRGLRGHIGLQNHDNASVVRFRNLRITPL